MKSQYIVAILLTPLALCGQKHDYNWMFIENFFPNNGLGETSIMDFRTAPPTISVPDSVRLTTWSSVAVMSDAGGELIFFTNGCEVHDASFHLMENGDNLTPGPVHDEHCHYSQVSPGYSAGRQSCMALPMPNSNRYYYLFHIGKEYPEGSAFPTNCILYYTKIDMQGNGGLGRVVEKNVPLVANCPPNLINIDNLTAVKHANGRDWWIVSIMRYGNGYFKFLATEEGVELYEEQHIGFEREEGILFSQIAFSADGALFAHNTNRAGVQLLDFDRETGAFSNPRFYPIASEVGSMAGVAFSPSGRYLYASIPLQLYQYDLWAEDVEGSRVLVAEYDGYADPIPTHFYLMQLGPDCQLYLFCPSCRTIHVIRHPDRKGLGCEVVQNDIHLPWGVNLGGVATFPNYRLGALGEPSEPCTAPVGTVEPPAEEGGLLLYPNPAQDVARLSWQGIAPAEGQAVLRDAAGREVLRAPLRLSAGEAELSVRGLPAGWYSLFVEARGERRVARLVVAR